MYNMYKIHYAWKQGHNVMYVVHNGVALLQQVGFVVTSHGLGPFTVQLFIVSNKLGPAKV